MQKWTECGLVLVFLFCWGTRALASLPWHPCARLNPIQNCIVQKRMFDLWILWSVSHFHKLTWGVRSSSASSTCINLNLPAGAPLLFLLHRCKLCRKNIFSIQSSIVERIQSSDLKKNAPSLSSLLERNESYRFSSWQINNSPSPVCVPKVLSHCLWVW